MRGKPVEIVAFKILRKDRLKKNKDVRHVIDEKKLMAKINHPFVARLFGVGQDQTRLFFILEHIQGGDLFSLIRRKRYLPSDMANLCAAEVVLALGHMHDLGSTKYPVTKQDNRFEIVNFFFSMAKFCVIRYYLPRSQTRERFVGYGRTCESC